MQKENNSLPVHYRVIMATQSGGTSGKSTTAELASAFLGASGVPHRLTDADAEHRTLSKRMAEADIASINEPGELMKLIYRIGKGPKIEIIDMPAQKTDFILSTFEQFNVLDIAAAEKIRFTILLFVADSPASEDSLEKTVRAFTNKVDYLVIKNPARYKSTHYIGGPLQTTLRKLGACEIDIPLITQTTLDELLKAKGKLGRWLPLTEAAQSDVINKYSQHEIQFVLNRMYAQFNAAKHLIFPDGVVGTWKPLISEKPTKVELNFDINLS